MSIIKRKTEAKKERVKLELSSDINQQINDYMQWAGIDDIGYFFEEAALFVFKQDREWKKHLKNKKKESIE